ncbi:uncharacterized protein LOC121379418 [Gigantopelta aegis]|uniref:uncharacterized protein LOC121379418 n=1 Tax=Gigantopelta aegis TaxID=1735272 RepID=UPI001B887BF8|nr:uncharacterized protein LOC121379418 [Gigantopelta aegis]
MAASSSGRRRHAAMQPFEFDISIDPVLVSEGGEQEVDDEDAVFQCLKDVTLLSKCFERFQNAKVVKMSPDLKITLSVSSLEEFEEIKEVINKGDLTKTITEFANGLGLEMDLGITARSSQKTNVRLDMSLMDKRRTAKQAKKHFETPLQSTQTEVPGGPSGAKERSKELKTENITNPVPGSKKTEESRTSTSSVQKNPDIGTKSNPVLQTDKSESNGATCTDVVPGSKKTEESRTSTSSVQKNPDIGTKSNPVSQTDKSESNGATHTDVPAPTCQIQMIMHNPIEKNLIKEFWIELQSKQADFKAETPFYPLCEGLWITSMISIPIHCDSLQYKCEFTQTKGYFGYSWLEKIHDKSWKTVERITPMIREFSMIKGKVNDIEMGFAQHVNHMLAIVNSTNLKDAIMDVDSLVYRARQYMKYKPMNKKTVIQNIHQHLNQSTPCWEVFILFGYVCGLLIHVDGYDCKTKEDIKASIPQQTSQEILKSLKMCSPDHVPSGSLHKLQNIVIELCHIAFPNRPNHILDMFEFCYPAMSSTFLLNCFNFCGPLPFPCSLETCKQICRNILAQEKAGDKCAPELLQKLLRHSQLDTTIGIVNSLVLSKSHHQQKLLELLKTRIIVDSKQYYRDNNFEALLMLVNDLELRHEAIVSVVSDTVTGTVISMIKGLNKSDSVAIEFMKKCVESPVLFKSQDSCKSLYEVMATSQNEQIHSYFLERLCSDQVIKTSDELTHNLTLKWFVTAVRHHCCEKKYNLKKFEELPFVYRHLSQLLKIESISEREKLVFDLKEKTFDFVCSIPLKDFVQGLCEKETLENLPEIFSEHLFRMLSEHSDKKDNILTAIGKSSSDHFEATSRYD